MTQDAIVVGAGPAGAAAALELARRGARVRLIERTRFPRPKACGDGLTPRALAALDELGVAVPRVPAIRSVLVRSPNVPGVQAEYAFSSLGTVLSRLDLDDRIASAAARAGAELLEKTRAESLIVEGDRVCGVRIRGEAGSLTTLRAPVTIIAEGSLSRLARQAPVTPVRGVQVGFAVRRYLEGVEWEGAANFEILFPLENGGLPAAGYAWIFPAPEGRANIGVGYFDERESPAGLGTLLRQFEDTLLRGDPRFRRARAVERPLGAPVRIGSQGARSHAEGLLLVGDSAGLASPFWAEGISAALESGRLAAETSMTHLEDGSSLAEYGRALTRQRPNLDRFGPSLAALYRNLRHVARDVPPALARPGRLPQALFGTMEAERPAPLPRTLPRDSTENAVRIIRARARRVAGRDRPVLAELLEQLDRVSPRPTSVIPIFLAARSLFPGFDVRSSQLRRCGVVLELLRMACDLLGEVAPDDSGRDEASGGRGGAWLASTLALCMGDRLLARCFALTARLDSSERTIIATTLCQVMEDRAASSLRAGVGSRPATGGPELGVAAARTGALLGGASLAVVQRFGEAARLHAKKGCEPSLEGLRTVFEKARSAAQPPPPPLPTAPLGGDG